MNSSRFTEIWFEVFETTSFVAEVVKVFLYKHSHTSRVCIFNLEYEQKVKGLCTLINIVQSRTALKFQKRQKSRPIF